MRIPARHNTWPAFAWKCNQDAFEQILHKYAHCGVRTSVKRLSDDGWKASDVFINDLFAGVVGVGY